MAQQGLASTPLRHFWRSVSLVWWLRHCFRCNYLYSKYVPQKYAHPWPSHPYVDLPGHFVNHEVSDFWHFPICATGVWHVISWVTSPACKHNVSSLTFMLESYAALNTLIPYPASDNTRKKHKSKTLLRHTHSDSGTKIHQAVSKRAKSGSAGPSHSDYLHSSHTFHQKYIPLSFHNIKWNSHDCSPHSMVPHPAF